MRDAQTRSTMSTACRDLLKIALLEMVCFLAFFPLNGRTLLFFSRMKISSTIPSFIPRVGTMRGSSAAASNPAREKYDVRILRDLSIYLRR